MSFNESGVGANEGSGFVEPSIERRNGFDINVECLDCDMDECDMGDGLDVVPLNAVGGDANVVPIPEVGMAFDSWEEVEEYYKSYGKQEGFGIVRAAGAYVRGSKKRRNLTWTCESYGRFERGKRSGKEKEKDVVTDSVMQTDGDPMVDGEKISKKCECPVSLYAAVSKEGKWVVKKVVNEHKNHVPLTPSKTHYIHMYRKGNLTDRVRRKLLNDSAVGIPLAQIHTSLAEQANGVAELGLTQRDLRNCANEDKRLKMEDGDVEAMLSYFEKMCANNQNFFHMHRCDANGHLQDILWVDARSRAAYEEFGDVVCFDATYLTNKYHLPFANFVGVNHHGQSILLGCALISHETAETYEWVFKTWLLCMGGKAPDGILTDQAAAMRKALRHTMPETTHRWCLWHITSKFGAKLKGYKGYDEFVEELKNIIYDSLDTEEFERRWARFIVDHNLSDDEWLKGLFEERHMWVPAFVKHLFWAGMKTTQRVESINSFFDNYVDKDTRLYEFAERYIRAMESRTNTETEADAKSARFVRELVYRYPAEIVFRKLYTDAKFKEVLRECSRLNFLNCIESQKRILSDHVTEHAVEDRIWIKLKNSKKEIPSDDRVIYRVRHDKRDHDISCSCKYFDSHGIMCRHMIKVYDVEKVKVIPKKFILRRWRKDVRRKHARVKVAYHDPGKTAEVRRFEKLMAAFEDVCWKAAANEENVDVVMELVNIISSKVDENNVRLKSSSAACSNRNQRADTNNSSDVNCGLVSTTPTATHGHSRLAAPLTTPEQGSCPNPESGFSLTQKPSMDIQSIQSKEREKVKDPPVPKKVGRPRTKRLVSAAEQAQNKARKKGASSKGKDNEDQQPRKGRRILGSKDFEQLVGNPSLGVETPTLQQPETTHEGLQQRVPYIPIRDLPYEGGVHSTYNSIPSGGMSSDPVVRVTDGAVTRRIAATEFQNKDGFGSQGRYVGGIEVNAFDGGVSYFTPTGGQFSNLSCNTFLGLITGNEPPRPTSIPNLNLTL